MLNFFKWTAASFVATTFCAMAATPLSPQRDDQVLEILPAITRHRPMPAPLSDKPAAASSASLSPPNPAVAASHARQYIAMARQTGETRYWGRAQAVLAPWWDHPHAPADLAILQATVQQGRHEFEASRKVLTAALARAPGHAQGWLNLAALERLSANYPQALVACGAVARAGQALYAQACQLETQSLQGAHALAMQGLQRLIAQLEESKDPTQQSWLWSLLAESFERAGQDGPALNAYRRSLALESDLYTAIAHSDLLLRTAKPSLALNALAALPETDAVVLRRAAAWRQLKDDRWVHARAMLTERFTELVRRGDDPTLHGRELALTALWLDDDAPRALLLARQNLRLQREPLDWWVALRSAKQAKNTVAVAGIKAEITAIGLHDKRLEAVQP